MQEPPIFVGLGGAREKYGRWGQKAVVLSISKIIWWNLGWRYKIVWTTSVKMIFPLATHTGGISQLWMILANFWHQRNTKVHDVVTLWVWEIIKREKGETIPYEVLQKVTKLFFPWRFTWGNIPNIRSNIWNIPPCGTPGAKLFGNVLEDLVRYLLAFLALNYLSNSQSYDIMNFGISLVSKFDQNLSMLRNPPVCAARGKVILTQAFHMIL